VGEFSAKETSYRNHDYYAALSGRHDRALRSYLRLLDEVQHTDETYDILFAVDDLLQDYYDLDDAGAAMQLRNGAAHLLPSDDMFNDSELYRQAKELLLLFPLRYMGDDLAQTVALQEAEGWYYHVGSAIIERTSGTHGFRCQEEAVGLRCEHSVQCPWRVLKDILTTPIVQADLAALSYMLEPDTESAFAHMKMNVAMQLRLISSTEGSKQSGFYDYLIAAKRYPDEQ
jgi:hypothetical protein